MGAVIAIIENVETLFIFLIYHLFDSLKFTGLVQVDQNVNRYYIMLLKI